MNFLHTKKRLVVPKASREMKQYCDLSKKFTYQMFLQKWICGLHIYKKSKSEQEKAFNMTGKKCVVFLSQNS